MSQESHVALGYMGMWIFMVSLTMYAVYRAIQKEDRC